MPEQSKTFVGLSLFTYRRRRKKTKRRNGFQPGKQTLTLQWNCPLYEMMTTSMASASKKQKNSSVHVRRATKFLRSCPLKYFSSIHRPWKTRKTLAGIVGVTSKAPLADHVHDDPADDSDYCTSNGRSYLRQCKKYA